MQHTERTLTPDLLREVNHAHVDSVLSIAQDRDTDNATGSSFKTHSYIFYMSAHASRPVKATLTGNKVKC
ncbi:unnamed protein product [Urochloa humidicola]